MSNYSVQLNRRINKPEGRLHDLPEGADKAHLCEALLSAGQRGDVGIAAEAVAVERATRRPHRLERYTSMKFLF